VELLIATANSVKTINWALAELRLGGGKGAAMGGCCSCSDGGRPKLGAAREERERAVSCSTGFRPGLGDRDREQGSPLSSPGSLRLWCHHAAPIHVDCDSFITARARQRTRTPAFAFQSHRRRSEPIQVPSPLTTEQNLSGEHPEEDRQE
jgi:hypothetical protein